MWKLDDVIGIVSSHVAKTGRRKTPVTADTALFEEGLVDSFAMAELTDAFEKKQGRPLPEGALLPDDFASPRTLHARLNEVLG